MTVTIMIDGSVKHNRKFDFKLQSSHVIENHYKSPEKPPCVLVRFRVTGRKGICIGMQGCT